MGMEQVARDFIMNLGNVEKWKPLTTADAMASGGVLPQPLPLMEAGSVIAGMMGAFPDLKFDIQQVMVDGNKAKVNVILSGTNTGPLSLPVPGMMNIPPTGKKMMVKDTFVVTLQGDKVSHLTVDSPADGGIPAALAQIGVKMPGM
jgi:hypothetical protein